MTNAVREAVEYIAALVLLVIILWVAHWLLQDLETNGLILLSAIGLGLMVLMMVPWLRYLALLGGAIAFLNGVGWVQADTERRREQARHEAHWCPVCRRRLQNQNRQADGGHPVDQDHRPRPPPGPDHDHVQPDYDLNTLPYNRDQN